MDLYCQGEGILKKKVVFIAIFLLICVIAGLHYRNNVISRTDGYVRFIEWIMSEHRILKFHKRVYLPGASEGIMKEEPYWIESQERIQVEEIIKRNPTELVIIVKWGYKGKAYVSIKNWLTRKHDRIVIYPLDIDKGMVIYE
jgi:hypothetical protein